MASTIGQSSSQCILWMPGDIFFYFQINVFYLTLCVSCPDWLEILPIPKCLQLTDRSMTLENWLQLVLLNFRYSIPSLQFQLHNLYRHLTAKKWRSGANRTQYGNSVTACMAPSIIIQKYTCFTIKPRETLGINVAALTLNHFKMSVALYGFGDVTFEKPSFLLITLWSFQTWH